MRTWAEPQRAVPRASSSSLTAARVQRKCACSERDSEPCTSCGGGLLARSAAAGAPTPALAPSLVHDVVSGPGQPLPSTLRTRMESGLAAAGAELKPLPWSPGSGLRIGSAHAPEEQAADRAAARALAGPGNSGVHFDFSRVQLHADARARASAEAVHARAYTVGDHIVLGPGASITGSAGMQLLAHELAHVVQQTGGTARVQRQTDPRRRAPHHPSGGRHHAGGGGHGGHGGHATTGGSGGHATSSGGGGHARTWFHCRTPSDHRHRPTRDWATRQRTWARHCAATTERTTRDLRRGRFHAPDTRQVVECICASSTPATALELARRGTMFPGGLASDHIDHYLTGGGADFHENMRDILLNDAGVRAKIAAALRHAPRGCVSIEQSDYASHDFKYAFGAIDRMDYEVAPGGASVHVWFRDRYEWHPEDTGRPSNCVHIAAVELKDSGAADYWMVGDASVPMSWFTSGPAWYEHILP